MSEEKLLQKYGCNSLSEFIDTYLDCETAFDLLRTQFKEIERLNENNQAMQEEMARTWEKLAQKENIIKEVREYIEHTQNYGKEKILYINGNDILEILNKGSDKE